MVCLFKDCCSPLVCVTWESVIAFQDIQCVLRIAEMIYVVKESRGIDRGGVS
jgi:hypothetical protein